MINNKDIYDFFDNLNEIEMFLIKSLNQYRILVIFFLNVHFLVAICYDYLYSAIMILILNVFHLRKKSIFYLYENIRLLTFSVIILILIASFYSSYLAITLRFLLYITMLFGIPFFFNLKQSRIQIFILVSLMIINILIYYFNFFSIDFDDKKKERTFIGISIEVSIFVITTLYFSFKNTKLMSRFYFELEEFKIKFNLDNFSNKENSLNDEENINRIVTIVSLAKLNNPAFLTEFNLLYKDFFNKILNISSDIISSELEICALIKLNFTTKEIALATNSSVRSIEAKKYRIRKKLKINSSDDLFIWMNTL
jgi:DNA-binding CsgD family transcriptional regulator